jgi:hypothetical protein
VLEAMLAGLPTAVLDYTNSPAYLPAAWTITAQNHIHSTLDDLLNPPARRLAFQDEVLSNALESHSPATPRMVTLIEEMAHIGRQAREQNKQPDFPARISPRVGRSCRAIATF